MPQSDALFPRFPGKNALRVELKARRAAITAEERRQWDSAIARRLLELWHQHPFRTWGVYRALSDEPDLSGLYVELAARGVALSLSVVTGKNAPLQFAAWTPGDALVARAYGVLEPATVVPVQLPEALLIPCLGFTAQGYRLGYGGGFYDRTLTAAARPPFTVGVAYRCLSCSFTPSEHDVALDVMVTDSDFDDGPR